MNLENKIKSFKSNKLKNSDQKVVYALNKIVFCNECNLDVIALEYYKIFHKGATAKFLYSKLSDPEYLSNLLESAYGEFMERYFSKIIYETSEEKKQKKQKEIENEIYKYVGEAIKYILTTRYTLHEIVDLIPYTSEAIKLKLKDKDYIDRNFGEGIYEQVREKIILNSRTKNFKNGVKVCSEEMCAILKPDVYKLDPLVYKKIKVLIDYLKSEGNISFVISNNSKKDVVESNCIEYYISILGNKELLQFLKDDVYEYIQKCYSIEMSLMLGLSEKYKLFEYIHGLIIEYDYDYETVFKISGIPKNLFYRILNNDIYRCKYEELDKQKINSIKG